jgi:hypothetical protein
MRIVLVGCAKGHRQIQWGAAFIIGVTLGLVGAAVATGFYYLLGGEFSLLAAMTGFLGPSLMVGAGVLSACQLPVGQLTKLDG